MILGAGALQVGGARQQFWHGEGGIHGNLKSAVGNLPMGGWNGKKEIC